MIFVIGSRGRLGQALVSSHNGNVIAPERRIYETWWQKGSIDEIFKYFEPKVDTDSVIFIPAGILDPKLPQEQHLRVNYFLPKNIIDAVKPLGVKVVTFGTIMETLISKKNKYVISKSMLGEYIGLGAGAYENVVHIRIHTLYGSADPSPFMFLGQIEHALKTQTPFLMSSGEQIREYHHIEDDVIAIKKIVEAGEIGAFNLNHGQPLSLKEIATHIFKAFNIEKSLKIGVLPAPEEENYSMALERPALLGDIKFRETLGAVVAYFEERGVEIGRGNV